jgi:hypothetical protein
VLILAISNVKDELLCPAIIQREVARGRVRRDVWLVSLALIYHARNG